MKRSVKPFLGMTGYYRRLLSSPARTVQIRTRQCEEAFHQLKTLLCTKPIPQSPDFSKQFIVQTDASDHRVGAVLSQLDGEGKITPMHASAASCCHERKNTQQLRSIDLPLNWQSRHFRYSYLEDHLSFKPTIRHSLLDCMKEDNSRLRILLCYLRYYGFFQKVL